MAQTMKLPPVSAFEAQDFSGGLNLRDAPSKLEPGDSPDCMNITLDERGGGAKRLGLLRMNASALAGVPKNLFYSSALSVNIIQIGASLYKTSDWVTVTAFATFTTSARAGLCDFNGKLVAVHPVDGVFDYDGTTWSSRNATVKGTTIAPWQNKLWVAGDGARVWWSNAGSSATWTTASDFNDLREKDNKACTAIGIGQGMDVAGRPGLLVFKEDSTYRINSSSTGSYTTIDSRAGCSGPLALVSLFGYTLAFNKSGIYRCDGNTMELASSKLEPLFDKAQINLTYLPDVVAGVFQDRAVFSFPFGSAQTTNNRTLEYHPLDGWIVPHDFGASGYTIDSTGKLLSASPTAAYVRETFRGGDDEGSDITTR
ncbi:MAG: hypothetical protein NUW01_08935, partial [Gemmatimonadaceae bacterium]|nr:hypothetical protein [Gemmatimonadaceae bacterium]